MSPTTFAMIVSAAILVCALALGALIFVLLRVRQESQIRNRLDPVAPGAASADFEVAPPPLMAGVARSGKAIEKMVDTEGESSRLMQQAGWRSAQARLGWYLFQGGLPLAIFAGVAAFFVFSESPQKLLFGMLLVIVAAILSFLAPRWILRSRAAARRKLISREVPLFVHLLVLLFESGLSTRQALASIVREGGGVLPELGRELELAIRQIEAGAETGETLKALDDLLEVADLSTVLGLLRQVDRYGGELREPLLETLKVIEERRGYEIREQVNLLSGRMTLVMVLFFFPALLIFVAGPAFLGIIRALGNVNGG